MQFYKVSWEWMFRSSIDRSCVKLTEYSSLSVNVGAWGGGGWLHILQISSNVSLESESESNGFM